MSKNILSIYENFVNKRNEKGVTAFRKSDLTSKHINDVLDYVAKDKGVPIKELHAFCDAKLQKIKDLEAKSPILYSTIAQNVIESAVFHVVTDEDHHPDTGEKIAVHGKGALAVKGASSFNTKGFFKLVRHIQHEHKQFFPLHNFHDDKVLYSPVFILFPDEHHKDDPVTKQVTTACATAEGKFYFYVPFCQQLINYAHVIGVKPKGKKYKSNGGEIPDDWAYIEFLIIHELMHYTYADFHYQKLLKADPQIINWVGDFRTNYLLVKSGYEQPPIGLFSDDVNYDRQKNYKEMYEVVKKEFEKLSKDEQGKAMKAMGELMDDHLPGEATGKGDGSGAEGKTVDEILGEIDKAHKQAEDKLGEGASKDAGELPKPDQQSEIGSNRRDNSTTKSANTLKEFDWQNVKPTFNWAELLSRFAKSAMSVEETYQRPDRRMSTSIHTAAQLGAAVVKPGELQNPAILKLGVCVDSSGSMTHILPRVYSELKRLLKNPMVQGPFIMIKYSDSYKGFLCDIKKGTYGEMAQLDKPKGTKTKTGNILDLMKSTFGGGTEFTAELVDKMLSLTKQGFGLVILTDSDVLWDVNYTHLQKLLKEGGSNVGIIFDRKDSFIAFAKKYKSVPKNVTYFA